MKKIVLLLAAIAMSIILAGCGGSQNSGPTIEDALSSFDNGDKEGAITILHEIEESGNTSIYVSDPVSITAVYAYNPANNSGFISADGKERYNLYIFGEVAAPTEDIAKTQIGAKNESMISLTLNNKNNYYDSTAMNRTNSDIKAIKEKGYGVLQSVSASNSLETGDDPYKFVARVGISANDFNYENGIVAIDIDNLWVDGKSVGGDNAIVFPISDITVLNSEAELYAMIDSL